MIGDSQRLDAALVARGLASGREKAKELIAAGLVTVNGHKATKASQAVAASAVIECADTLHRFVGRGGEKLEKVLQETMLSPEGGCCLDVGASTGGFTDCLLRHGAARVYALDVGHGQLHPSLCADARVDASSAAALLRLLVPGIDVHARVGELSGGQRRRVEIARALLCGGCVVILDEPFTGLDTAARDATTKVVLDLLDGRMLLLATHDVADAQALDISGIITL